MTAIVIAVSSVVVAFGYFRYKKTYSYFKKLGIHGPTPIPLLGNFGSLLKHSVVEFEEDWYKKYGPVYGSYDLDKPILVVGDPEAVKNIMVRDFGHFVDRQVRFDQGIFKYFLTNMRGDDWRRARNTISPTFTSGKMKNMLSLMMTCVESLEKSLEQKASKGQEFDAKDVFGFYTMDIVAKCAFATETQVQEMGYDNPFMRHASVFLRPPIWRILLGLSLPQSLGFSFFGKRTLEYLEGAIRNIYQQRKIQGDTVKRSYKDLLQLLIDAMHGEDDKENEEVVKDSEGHHSHEGNSENNNPVDPHPFKKGVCEDELVANALLVLAAGYETTATLLTYATYLLAVNQDVQDILREEVREAFESAGNQLKYEDLSSLKYLDAVICETLRLYSPVVRMERQCTQDYVLKTTVNGRNTEIALKAGDIVRLPFWCIQHDEKYWPQAKTFKPERFLPENKVKMTPFTYLPFGAGPRNCIGMRFALLEAKLALASSVLKYRYIRCEKTPDTPTLSKARVLLGSHGLIIKVEKL